MMELPRPSHEPTPQILPETVSKEKKKNVHCRFYNTKKGCRSGESCPFIHDASRTATSSKQSIQKHNAQEPSDGTASAQPSSVDDIQPAGSTTRDDSASLRSVGRQPLQPLRPVPVAQQKDPRAFQISQVKRRFSPEEVIDTDGSTTTLSFSLHPSDPDFPFDLPSGLECSLIIPDTYLSLEKNDEKPKLKVRNEELGALWRSRVEDDFGRLFHGNRSNITLLSSLNRLDRDLEALLTDKKPELVTIIPNRNKAPSVQAASQSVEEQTQPPQTNSSRYTAGQVTSASQSRQTEIRQLEARLGRLPGFSKSADGTSFVIPIVPRKPSELPVRLRLVSATGISVPSLYPLQSCSIELQNVDRDAAAPVERAFARKVEKGDGTLMGHINMLAQNMQILAAEGKAMGVEGPAQSTVEPKSESGIDAADPGKAELRIDEDRDHVRYIPRPPEWDVSNINHDAHEESGDSSCSESEIDSDEESGEIEDEGDSTANAAAAASYKPTHPAERGISLSFPTMELYSIELLELSSLSITVKCSRCKDTMDIPNLRHSTARNQSCKKCAIPFTLTYRRELIHAHSTRAGYLDLEGCTVVDMLPSTFLPTCSQCSTTPSPSSGVVSVRGASSLAICRECHAKMTFKIPNVKFLIVTAGSSTGAPALKKKKPKENLGITTGTELPRRGRCGHYSKSYRWFRFSCCEKVFPCDRCHDAECDHPVEHANRMICGFCSREQNYRPEDCGFCHASVVKKAGSGFWEGGKGTRDKARMSRKDPRKYKRQPGGAMRKK